MNSRAAILLPFLTTLLWSQAGQPSVAVGRQFYVSLCSRCHGMSGEGGNGPDLRTPIYRRAPDPGTLVQLISTGIPGTDMPRQPGLTLNNAIAIAAYLRTLGHTPQERPAGDAQRGEQIYRGKGNCASCHSMNGGGGVAGPDLTAAGRSRGLAYLRTAIVEPDRQISEANLTVRVTTGTGTVQGARVHEDTFTIAIREADGTLRTFDKDGAAIEYLWSKSPMPSYRDTLSAREIDDLVAYLAARLGDR